MAARLCPFCMRMAEEDTCTHCGKNVNYAGSPAHLPAGYVVSGRHPYVLGAALGQGGFGITYIALDMITNERVAIKEYYPSYCSTRTNNDTVTAYSSQEEVYQKGKERFLDEARTLKSLSDLKNIVNVLDFFEANNSAYLVMEFLDGSSLKEYAAENGKFPAQKFLDQIRPLIEDIHRMHERGVVHRDIAPDNIILLPDGQMKLIDFGAARSYVGDKSMTVVVKKGFAPVEQYLSKGTTASTDVYALAATIYYCITGTVPMDSAERQYDHVPLPSPSSLGADITPLQEKALDKALEIQQKERTQTVQVFLDNLSAKAPAQKKVSVSKTEPKKAVSAEKKQPRKKKKFPVVLAAAATVLVLCAGFFLFGGKSSDSLVPAETKPALQNPEEGVSEQTVPQTAPVTVESPADRITENVTLSVVVAQYGSQSASWWADYTAAFEAKYPKVDLELDVVSWNDIYTIVNGRIANGVAPDILNIDVFADYQADGLLLPVPKYMSEETYARFYPQFLEQSSLNGKVWAVPDLTSVRAFFYNKQIFEELGLDAPSSWSDIELACQVIRQKYPNINPIGLDMTTDDGHSTFGCFALSNGGGFVDNNGEWNLNSAENVETLDFLKGLVNSRYASPNSTTQTRWELRELFADGKIAMMIAPDNFSSALESAGLSYGVVPIPAPEGKQSSTLAVMDRFMCFDNNQSKSELAAITCFFDFFYEDERYVEWTTMEGFLPATSTGNELLAAADPSKAVWRDILPSSTFLPVEKENWIDVKIGIIATMQQTLLGGNPETILSSLQQEIAQ